MRYFLATHKKISITFGLALFLTVLLFSRMNTFQAEAASNNTGRYKYYKSIQIQEGDSLWSIAKTYCSYEYDSIQDYIHELKTMNNLDNDLIQVGNYLTIAYYSETYK